MTRNRKPPAAAVPPEPRPVGAEQRPLPLVVGALCVLIVAGVVYYVVYPQAAAAYHWRAAQQALAERDFAGAQAHLRDCLEAWPQSGETHFLLARTSRRA